jgi:hypothetical protein
MRFSAAVLLIASIFTAEAHGTTESGSGKPTRTASETMLDLVSAARGAIAADKFQEVPRIWLLANSWRSIQSGLPPVTKREDSELASAMWLALARLNLCTDNLPTDRHGLWSIAIHNALIHNLVPREPEDIESPFDGFESGLQTRKISWSDTLSAEELSHIDLKSTSCRSIALAAAPVLDTLPSEMRREGLESRRNAALVLRHYLRIAKTALTEVRATSIVEARLFDIALFLAGSKTRDPDAEAILTNALSWKLDDWMALTPQRRLLLYRRLMERQSDTVPNRELLLAIIDTMIERKTGTELLSWMGYFSYNAPPEIIADLWRGERGTRLLSLDTSTGFRGRGAIALTRAIDFLQRGETRNAILSLAYAMRYAADDQPNGDATLGLARRWISFVMGGWETDAALLTVLRDIIPREELVSVLEDLAWRAAFRADRKSFEAAYEAFRTRGAAATRVAQLEALVRGDVGRFTRELQKRLIEEPYSSLRFSQSLVDRIEAEDAPIRTRLLPVLRMLTAVGAAQKGEKRPRQTLIDLARRSEQILEGEDKRETLTRDEKARKYASSTGVFVGNVRLAPSDPLPWPFPAPRPKPAQIFTTIKAMPERWSGDNGTVLGWRLAE